MINNEITWIRSNTGITLPHSGFLDMHSITKISFEVNLKYSNFVPSANVKPMSNNLVLAMP